MIIKPIDTPERIKEVAGIEAETWGVMQGETVPDHLLTALAHEGGILLGAYDGGQLIGFTLGWLGLTSPGEDKPVADQVKLVSHMTGVLSGFRDQRVGYQLKLAQRDWALQRDLDLITWTFDPLESRNAYLNMHLLGCVCRTYFRDYYGEMTDEINQGIPSDRFRVDWWIRSRHVVDRLGKADQKKGNKEKTGSQSMPQLEVINPADHDSAPLPIPAKSPRRTKKDQILIEIPADFQTIRQENLGLAHNWRSHTRELFEQAFSSDSQVVDLIYQRGELPRSFYMLERLHR